MDLSCRKASNLIVVYESSYPECLACWASTTKTSIACDTAPTSLSWRPHAYRSQASSSALIEIHDVPSYQEGLLLSALCGIGRVNCKLIHKG